MRHACLLTAALLCIAATPSFCESKKTDMSTSGNQFLETCGDALETSHLSAMDVACMTYVDGLVGGISMFADKGSIQEMYCSPSEVTVG
jgi:hypothetical protein